jgi:hypothetical protein
MIHEQAGASPSDVVAGMAHRLGQHLRRDVQSSDVDELHDDGTHHALLRGKDRHDDAPHRVAAIGAHHRRLLGPVDCHERRSCAHRPVQVEQDAIAPRAAELSPMS